MLLRKPFIERGPAVIECLARVALEAVRELRRCSSAFDGLQRDVHFRHGYAVG
jgi:hypothetical protein